MNRREKQRTDWRTGDYASNLIKITFPRIKIFPFKTTIKNRERKKKLIRLPKIITKIFTYP